MKGIKKLQSDKLCKCGHKQSVHLMGIGCMKIERLIKPFIKEYCECESFLAKRQRR